MKLLNLSIALTITFSSIGCVPIDPFIEGTCQNGPPPPKLAPYACGSEIQAYLENETVFDSFALVGEEGPIMVWGAYDKPMNTGSVRKSVMSLLMGIAENKGLLDIHDTLESLGIDDHGQLTDVEKTATIENLLQARSGIYLPAIGESQQNRDAKPRRGSHAPGEFWYYNNWDFNTLGTIFEQETGLKIGDAIQEWLAKPLQMQTFCPSHVTYETSDETEIPMWRIYMSTLDLAQLALTVLNEGRVGGKEIVPQAWIDKSTTKYSETKKSNFFDGYAYLWWLGDEDTIWADGFGGQSIAIDRKAKLALVARNHTGASAVGYIWFLTSKEDETFASPKRALELLEMAKSCKK